MQQLTGLLLFGVSAVASLLVNYGISSLRRNLHGTRKRDAASSSSCHVTVEPHQLKERIIVVGDVHGCFDELRELLDKCQYDPLTSTLIFVGDLVNKGPYSVEVVRFVMQEKALCVMGNHEISLIQKIEDKVADHPFLHQLTSDEINWIKELPFSISIPSHKALIVHAGIVPHISLQEQNLMRLVNMRCLVKKQSPSSLPILEPIDSQSKSIDQVPWAEVYNCLDIADIHEDFKFQDANEAEARHKRLHVYFGHDAKKGLQLTEFATGLDTGVCYGNKISAMIIPERKLVQVDARRMYKKP